MRTFFLHPVVQIIIAVLSCSSLMAQTIVFTHANVIPMNREAVLWDYNVITKDGTIRELGPSSSTSLRKEQPS